MKVHQLLESNVIKLVNKQQSGNIDALSTAINASSAWTEQELDHNMPTKKPGVWLSIFVLSTNERVSVIGPSRTLAEAKQKLIQYTIDSIVDEEDQEYVDDEIGRIQEEYPDMWDKITLRGPTQAGKLSALILTDDELVAVITKGFIPNVEQVFVVAPTRAFSPPPEVSKLQSRISQLRFDLSQLPPGADPEFIQKQIVQLTNQLNKYKTNL